MPALSAGRLASRLRSIAANGLRVQAWLGILLAASAALGMLPGGRTLLALLLTATVLFVVPGALAYLWLFRRRPKSPAAIIGWGGTIGICLVGLLYPLASILDLPLTAAFWRAYAGLGLGAAIGLALRHRDAVAASLKASWRPDAVQLLLGLGLLCAAIAKLGAVWNLAIPPGHDPASHALMAKLIADAGNIPWSQLPFRSGPFFYPPGLAALFAAMHLFSTVSLPQIVLLMTNLSTILAALACYALLTAVTRSRGAGLFAFGFFAFLSLMPTNVFFLAGKNPSVLSNFLFLGIFLAAFRLAKQPSFAWSAILALLLAECFVIHYEKFYFLVPFLLAYLIALASYHRRVPWRPFLLYGVIAGVLALALVGPWLLRLYSAIEFARLTQTALVPDAAPPQSRVPELADFVHAVRSYWHHLGEWASPVLAWLSLLSPLALFLAPGFEVLSLLIFAALMSLFHPGIVEGFGLSMAVVTYDRVVIHFAYLPATLTAALGLWAIWRLAVLKFSATWAARARTSLLVFFGLLMLYGGIAQFQLYQQVTRFSALDDHDLQAFEWINDNLEDGRPFMFPVVDQNSEKGHYIVHEAGLYMPIFTDYDVACHFIRIETPQTRAEYVRYQKLIEERSAPFLARRYRYYIRDDHAYYQPLNNWLADQPPHTLIERYRNGPVRIVEIAPVQAPRMLPVQKLPAPQAPDPLKKAS